MTSIGAAQLKQALPILNSTSAWAGFFFFCPFDDVNKLIVLFL